jgi:hypothetical protein
VICQVEKVTVCLLRNANLYANINLFNESHAEAELLKRGNKIEQLTEGKCTFGMLQSCKKLHLLALLVGHFLLTFSGKRIFIHSRSLALLSIFSLNFPSALKRLSL